MERIEIKVSKFKPDASRRLYAIVIHGHHASGKTSLAKHLLKYLKCIQTIVLNDEKHEYSQENANGSVEEYKQVVHDIVKSQRELYRSMKNDRDSFDNMGACIIFENESFDETWAKNMDIRTCLMNGSSLNMKCIFVCENPIPLLPVFRACVDCVFVFKERDETKLRYIYEKFGSIFDSYNVFCQTLDQITCEPYVCMVIDNTINSNKVEDVVKWYKVN